VSLKLQSLAFPTSNMPALCFRTKSLVKLLSKKVVVKHNNHKFKGLFKEATFSMLASIRYHIIQLRRFEPCEIKVVTGSLTNRTCTVSAILDTKGTPAD
jgi:hypothetical protein